jgi:hypothetical protein
MVADSRERILAALRALRHATRVAEGTSAREKAEQCATFAEKLMGAHPADVLVACEEHARASQFWPTWNELVLLLGEARQRRLALEVRPLAPPRASPDDAALLAEPDGQAALAVGVGRPWLLARRKGERLPLDLLRRERAEAEAEFARLPDDAPLAGQLRKLWQERIAQEASLAAKFLNQPGAAP